eukprot:3449420-Pyramimonas_sp.AAC.2
MRADVSRTRRAHPRTTWARALWVTCGLALASCLYHGAVVTADLSGSVEHTTVYTLYEFVLHTRNTSVRKERYKRDTIQA